RMLDANPSHEREKGGWRRVVIPLVALVLVDLVTKTIALHFAPDRSVPEDTPFAFRLILNRSGAGVWASKLYAGKSGDDLMLAAAGYVLLTAYLVRVRRIRWNAGWTFLAGLGVLMLSVPVWQALFPAHFVGPTILGVLAYYVFLRRVAPDVLQRILAGGGVIGA